MYVILNSDTPDWKSIYYENHWKLEYSMFTDIGSFNLTKIHSAWKITTTLYLGVFFIFKLIIIIIIIIRLIEGQIIFLQQF